MSALYMIAREQWVPCALDEVFRFFSDATNLEVLTPKWLNFRILPPEPIRIATGSLLEYQLSWHGIPLRWKTEITRWEPPVAFEDNQLSGPCALWRHTHTFRAVGGGTLMKDVVRYSLPLGILGQIAHAMSVRRNVEAIFDYRYHRVHGLFGECP